MAVTLAQAAATESNDLRRGVIEVFRQESVVFDRIGLEDIVGSSYSYNVDGALPGTGFRTVNEAWVESTGVINQRNENLVILGGDADVDRFIERTKGGTIGSHRAYQIKQKVKSAQSTYVDALFNGDVNVNPKGFDGLRKRLIGDQVIDSKTEATNGDFLSELDDLFARVDGGMPDVVYANQKQIAKLKTLGRKSGGAEYINSEITGKREFTWNGVPFVDPGAHWQGREILPIVDGAGDFYAVKFATGENDPGVLGITNGGVQVYDLGELQEKPAYRVRIEFYTGLAVQGGRAAARLRGVKTEA